MMILMDGCTSIRRRSIQRRSGLSQSIRGAAIGILSSDPNPENIIAHEHWAQNGFANTDLDELLKQHGIPKIVLVDFIANSCVEATARYGMELGYHVTLIKDATAAFNPEGMEALGLTASCMPTQP